VGGCGRAIAVVRDEEAFGALERAFQAGEQARGRSRGELAVTLAAIDADDLLALTGATNVVPVEGWPQYSLESLLAAPPDLLLYPQGAVTPAAVEQLFRAAPELRRTTSVIGVDENRFTRPGPRVIEAAAELNAILDRWSMLRK